jgi:hypothetical protein
MTRDLQFEIIEVARPRILAWAARERIPLHRVEYVAPFVESDLSLSVWLFYDTDRSLAEWARNGGSDRLGRQFLIILSELGYPDELAAQVGFQLDSDENVRNNFEGSYFYRLR